MYVRANIHIRDKTTKQKKYLNNKSIVEQNPRKSGGRNKHAATGDYWK